MRSWLETSHSLHKKKKRADHIVSVKRKIISCYEKVNLKGLTELVQRIHEFRHIAVGYFSYVDGKW